MVATVVSALTNVTLANNNTGFGVWKRDGTGGTPSAISETDVFIQGTGACSVKVSNQGVVLAYATGGIDLSASNTHVYIWVNMLAGGLMAARASNGLCIFLSSDATLTTGSNYSMWAVDGSDTYPGGWVRYVIDVSKTRTTGAGTLNLTSVQHIGMYCDTRPNTAKFDNLVIDRIDYTTGPGLRVYGTSTTDDTFGDILTADEGTIGNKYGIVTSKGGIIYCRGRIELGDDVGTNAATLTDVDKVIVYENPLYYDGSSVVSCVSSTLYRLDFVGNGTGATDITLGKKVGTGDTASGRNGLLFLSAGPAVTMDFDDGNVNAAKIYGTTLRLITGGLTWGTNTAHEFIGNTVQQCAQVDFGSVIQRTNIYSGYQGTDGALLWNGSINIQNCDFIANANGTSNSAGIYHTSTGTFSYTGLNFSGNDYHAYNNSGGLITINASESNISAGAVRLGAGASVTVNNNVSVTLTGLQNPTEVRVFDAGTQTERSGTGNENVTTGSHTFSIPASTAVDIRILALSYQNASILNFSTATSTTIPVTQIIDRQYDNP